MGRVVLGPHAEPMKVWKGVEAIDHEGAVIAYNLINELEWNDDQGDSIGYGDLGCLEDWARQGRPFRNFVLESLREAREVGGEAEAAFCAVLTDYISLFATGTGGSAGRYHEFYKIETE